MSIDNAEKRSSKKIKNLIPKVFKILQWFEIDPKRLLLRLYRLTKHINFINSAYGVECIKDLDYNIIQNFFYNETPTKIDLIRYNEIVKNYDKVSIKLEPICEYGYFSFDINLIDSKRKKQDFTIFHLGYVIINSGIHRHTIRMRLFKNLRGSHNVEFNSIEPIDFLNIIDVTLYEQQGV